VLQTSLISAIITFCLTLVIIIPIALIMGVTGGIFGGSSGDFSDTMGVALGGLLTIFLPVIYGISAFLMTALWCWIYNLIAPKIGGIEIEVEIIEEPNINYPQNTQNVE